MVCALGEIAEWGGASADRQRDILASLPKRIAQLAAGFPVIPDRHAAAFARAIPGQS